MINVHLIYANEQNKTDITDEMLETVKKCCESVLATEGLDGSFEISFTLTDNECIRELNHNFRALNKSTDVLSFPMSDDGDFPVNMDSGDYILGDIVISAETAQKQAEEYGHSLKREIGFLTVHSVLHLLGYDHVHSEEEAKAMRVREKEVLHAIGLERK